MKKKTSQEWMVWEWPGYSWYQGFAPMRAWFYDFAKYGCQLNQVVATFSKGTEAYYFVRDEYTHAGKKFFGLVKSKPQIIFDILGNVDQAADKIFEIGKQQRATDFSKLSNKQILSIHKTLFKWDEQLWRQGQIPNILELSNSYLTDYVKQIIEVRFGQKKVNEIFTIVTTSHYSSMTEQQDKDFLSLLLKYKKLDAVVKDKILLHSKKYTWMTYGWSGPALHTDYFLQNFSANVGNKTTVRLLENQIKHKEEVLRKQKLILSQFSEEERVFLNMLRQFVESKAKRVDAHSLTYFLADRIMLEIGKRVGLSLNQIRMVVPEDIPKLFKFVDTDKINKEYSRVVIWYNKSKITKYVGVKGEEKISALNRLLPKVPRSRQIQGELAYPGKVRGKVRVVLDIKDGFKFRKGEILVTRMTDPNYISIMKLSKAIITDIGGITCHAAIVSRELRKPCIVGTQFATKFFKDGDIIEVDANKGIVRKL